MLLLPDARARTGLYLLVFLAGFLLALFAARSLSASRLGFLLLAAALFRATLLPRAPDLSDDIHRYTWDGKVARAGVSPYAHAPADPALARLDPEMRSRVAHPEIRTVYPPLAQAAFRVFGGSPLALKAFFSAADVAIVAMLWRRGPGGAFAAALYAFHPMPVTETAGQGHLDSLGVALLLAALAWMGRGRRAAAGVALAASVLTKYISGGAVPVLLRNGRVRFLAGSALFFTLVWTIAGRGASPVGGFSDFALRWDSNSVLYPAAVRFMEWSELPARAKDLFIAWKADHGHPPWTQEVFPFFYSAFFARVALAALLALALAWITWRVRDPLDGTFASLAVLLLLSPTLHPWYLLWLLPFAAVRKNAAFLYLSWAASLSYALMYPTPALPEAAVYAIEYVPFALLLLLGIRRARMRRIRREATP
ncbi:MAG: glycosyltransferase 87 family protein [Thermoanaerobaculia bacterium]